MLQHRLHLQTLRTAVSKLTDHFQPRSWLRMGNQSSAEKNKFSDSLIKAEQTLLEGGLAWWQSVQAARRSFLAPVCFSTFDIEIYPSPKENAVLFAEQEKLGRSLHIHTALYESSPKEVQEDETLSHVSDQNEVPIVLLHGYGSGIGIFSACLGPLAATLGRKVYAIDGLGCALSSRPKWTLGYGTQSNLDEVEEYSADAIELWRQQIGAEKIILCGHSIGGYLSVAYAERYPTHVDKLVLISPAGVAGPPKDDSSRKPSLLFRFARYLWAQGVSPLAASKYIFGRYFIDRYVERRFPDYDWLDKPAVADYMHGVWCHDEPSAGAYHHNTVLLPGAYARRPLNERVTQLKVASVAAIYGTSDWMNPTHFQKITQHFNQGSNSKDDNDSDAPRLTSLKMMLCADAGHNLQIDNPLAFVAAMQAYLNGSVTEIKTFVGDDFVYSSVA